jgi:hypothetical protein
MTRLAGAAALYVAVDLLHALDHVRARLHRLTVEVSSVGTLLLVLAGAGASAGAREVAHPVTA